MASTLSGLYKFEPPKSLSQMQLANQRLGSIGVSASYAPATTTPAKQVTQTPAKSVFQTAATSAPVVTGDPKIKKLQDDLVRLGYMSQADVNTGYGIYGPKTTAAYAQYENDVKTTSQKAYDTAIKQKTAGDVPTYAGNAITNPNQTAAEMTSTATGINNARNDIATGTTDPYKAASQSGIAYSPQELAAIEKAYAGIYDPVLNDVFTKLDAKEKADAKKADDEQWMSRQIFSANLDIQKWRATTGSKPGVVGDFSSTQLNSGASNAGMSINDFSNLDPDLQNYYINVQYGKDPVTNERKTKDQLFKDLLKEVSDGKTTPEDAIKEIADSDLPQAVKTFYINQVPAAPEVKDGFLDMIWNFITPF